MMYEEIAANKRKTWFLVLLVSALIIGLSTLFGYLEGLDLPTAVIVGTVLSSGYSLISYYLSDKVALMTNGAKEMQKTDSPEVWNVVENLCIANGQPMPKIYLVDDPSPNAFATGRDPEHASLAYTTGLLSIMNKTELEGITAHELSHMKNYDIRVMTIVVVLVGSIMLLANLFLRGMSFGGRRNKDNDAAGVLMIIGLILAILSPFIAQLIKLAVSRSREYLADASGALLTRYPEGLASALEKISAREEPLRHANTATAHLYISNPLGQGSKASFFSGLFSTHPPIEERIRRLREMGH